MSGRMNLALLSACTLGFLSACQLLTPASDLEWTPDGGGTCVPETIEEHCAGSCGLGSWIDKCGTERQECQCTLPQQCGWNNQQNKCGCAPLIYSSAENCKNEAQPESNVANWSIPKYRSCLYTVYESVVIDGVTKLMWQRKPDYEIRDWASAQSYCDSLNTNKENGCDSGWRLPSQAELESIIEGEGRYLNSEAFPEQPPDCYFWTATEQYSDAWLTGFGSFKSGWNPKSDKMYVRCVR